jgi:hypothetical protein
MLKLLDRGTPLCDGITRRDWLRIGGLGMMGLTLPNLLAARAQAGAARTGRAKSCIVLCFLGGPPQHETWDPKPDAPAEITSSCFARARSGRTSSRSKRR